MLTLTTANLERLALIIIFLSLQSVLMPLSPIKFHFAGEFTRTNLLSKPTGRKLA